MHGNIPGLFILSVCDRFELVCNIVITSLSCLDYDCAVAMLCIENLLCENDELMTDFLQQLYTIQHLQLDMKRFSLLSVLICNSPIITLTPYSVLFRWELC